MHGREGLPENSTAFVSLFFLLTDSAGSSCLARHTGVVWVPEQDIGKAAKVITVAQTDEKVIYQSIRPL